MHQLKIKSLGILSDLCGKVADFFILMTDYALRGVDYFSRKRARLLWKTYETEVANGD